MEDGWENVKQSKCKTDHRSATTAALEGAHKFVFCSVFYQERNKKKKIIISMELWEDAVGDKSSKGNTANLSLPQF